MRPSGLDHFKGPDATKLASLSEWHRPKRRYWAKLISLVLTLTFVFPYLTWAFETRPASLPLPQVRFAQREVMIPARLGSVTAAFAGGKRLVVCVQDLHCNYEAQTHIASIIETLTKEHGLRLVAVEGASRAIDVSDLADFPVADVRREVADHFVRLGKISGGEFFAATGEPRIELEGIEDDALYQANRRAVAAFLNDESQGLVYDLRELLEPLKSSVYTPALLDLDARRTDYRDGDLPLPKYAAFLRTLAVQHRLDPAAYPMLTAYVDQRQAAFASATDPDALYRQIDQVDQDLRRRLYTSEDQRRLDSLQSRLDILERLLNISATPQDLQEYRADPDAFVGRRFTEFAVQQAPHGDLVAGLEVEQLDRYAAQAAEFYRVADQRSRAFVRNTLSRMDDHRVDLSLLVTGGFHTDDVLDELRRQGVSYLCVRPRVDQQDLVNPYYSLLKNRHIPLEKLLAQNQEILALETSFPQVGIAPSPDLLVERLARGVVLVSDTVLRAETGGVRDAAELRQRFEALVGTHELGVEVGWNEVRGDARTRTFLLPLRVGGRSLDLIVRPATTPTGLRTALLARMQRFGQEFALVNELPADQAAVLLGAGRGLAALSGEAAWTTLFVSAPMNAMIGLGSTALVAPVLARTWFARLTRPLAGLTRPQLRVPSLGTWVQRWTAPVAAALDQLQGTRDAGVWLAVGGTVALFGLLLGAGQPGWVIAGFFIMLYPRIMSRLVPQWALQTPQGTLGREWLERLTGQRAAAERPADRLAMTADRGGRTGTDAGSAIRRGVVRDPARVAALAERMQAADERWDKRRVGTDGMPVEPALDLTQCTTFTNGTLTLVCFRERTDQLERFYGMITDAEGTPVGHVGTMTFPERPDQVLFRFLIYSGYQQRGYGSQALDLILHAWSEGGLLKAGPGRRFVFWRTERDGGAPEMAVMDALLARRGFTDRTGFEDGFVGKELVLTTAGADAGTRAGALSPVQLASRLRTLADRWRGDLASDPSRGGRGSAVEDRQGQDRTAPVGRPSDEDLFRFPGLLSQRRTSFIDFAADVRERLKPTVFEALQAMRQGILTYEMGPEGYAVLRPLAPEGEFTRWLQRERNARADRFADFIRTGPASSRIVIILENSRASFTPSEAELAIRLGLAHWDDRSGDRISGVTIPAEMHEVPEIIRQVKVADTGALPGTEEWDEIERVTRLAAGQMFSRLVTEGRFVVDGLGSNAQRPDRQQVIEQIEAGMLSWYSAGDEIRVRPVGMTAGEYSAILEEARRKNLGAVEVWQRTPLTSTPADIAARRLLPIIGARQGLSLQQLAERTGISANLAEAGLQLLHRRTAETTDPRESLVAASAHELLRGHQEARRAQAGPTSEESSLHVQMFLSLLAFIDKYQEEFQATSRDFRRGRVLNVGMESTGTVLAMTAWLMLGKAGTVDTQDHLNRHNIATYLQDLGVAAQGLDPMIAADPYFNHQDGFRNGVVENMPFRDGEFDSVVSMWLFNEEYIEDAVLQGRDAREFYTQAAREIHRVLRPGGHFLVSTGSMPNDYFLAACEQAGFTIRSVGTTASYLMTKSATVAPAGSRVLFGGYNGPKTIEALINAFTRMLRSETGHGITRAVTVLTAGQAVNAAERLVARLFSDLSGENLALFFSFFGHEVVATEPAAVTDLFSDVLDLRQMLRTDPALAKRIDSWTVGNLEQGYKALMTLAENRGQDRKVPVKVFYQKQRYEITDLQVVTVQRMQDIPGVSAEEREAIQSQLDDVGAFFAVQTTPAGETIGVIYELGSARGDRFARVHEFLEYAVGIAHDQLVELTRATRESAAAAAQRPVPYAAPAEVGGEPARALGDVRRRLGELGPLSTRASGVNDLAWSVRGLQNQDEFLAWLDQFRQSWQARELAPVSAAPNGPTEQRAILASILAAAYQNPNLAAGLRPRLAGTLFGEGRQTLAQIVGEEVFADAELLARATADPNVLREINALPAATRERLFNILASGTFDVRAKDPLSLPRDSMRAQSLRDRHRTEDRQLTFELLTAVLAGDAALFAKVPRAIFATGSSVFSSVATEAQAIGLKGLVVAGTPVNVDVLALAQLARRLFTSHEYGRDREGILALNRLLWGLANLTDQRAYLDIVVPFFTGTTSSTFARLLAADRTALVVSLLTAGLANPAIAPNLLPTLLGEVPGLPGLAVVRSLSVELGTVLHLAQAAAGDAAAATELRALSYEAKNQTLAVLASPLLDLGAYDPVKLGESYEASQLARHDDFLAADTGSNYYRATTVLNAVIAGDPRVYLKLTSFLNDRTNSAYRAALTGPGLERPAMPNSVRPISQAGLATTTGLIAAASIATSLGLYFGSAGLAGLLAAGLGWTASGLIVGLLGAVVSPVLALPFLVMGVFLLLGVRVRATRGRSADPPTNADLARLSPQWRKALQDGSVRHVASPRGEIAHYVDQPRGERTAGPEAGKVTADLVRVSLLPRMFQDLILRHELAHRTQDQRAREADRAGPGRVWGEVQAYWTQVKSTPGVLAGEYVWLSGGQRVAALAALGLVAFTPLLWVLPGAVLGWAALATTVGVLGLALFTRPGRGGARTERATAPLGQRMIAVLIALLAVVLPGVSPGARAQALTLEPRMAVQAAAPQTVAGGEQNARETARVKVEQFVSEELGFGYYLLDITDPDTGRRDHVIFDQTRVIYKDPSSREKVVGDGNVLFHQHDGDADYSFLGMDGRILRITVRSDGSSLPVLDHQYLDDPITDPDLQDAALELTHGEVVERFTPEIGFSYAERTRDGEQALVISSLEGAEGIRLGIVEEQGRPGFWRARIWDTQNGRTLHAYLLYPAQQQVFEVEPIYAQSGWKLSASFTLQPDGTAVSSWYVPKERKWLELTLRPDGTGSGRYFKGWTISLPLLFQGSATQVLTQETLLPQTLPQEALRPQTLPQAPPPASIPRGVVSSDLRVKALVAAARSVRPQVAGPVSIFTYSDPGLKALATVAPSTQSQGGEPDSVQGAFVVELETIVPGVEYAPGTFFGMIRNGYSGRTLRFIVKEGEGVLFKDNQSRSFVGQGDLFVNHWWTSSYGGGVVSSCDVLSPEGFVFRVFWLYYDFFSAQYMTQLADDPLLPNADLHLTNLMSGLSSTFSFAQGFNYWQRIDAGPERAYTAVRITNGQYLETLGRLWTDLEGDLIQGRLNLLVWYSAWGQIRDHFTLDWSTREAYLLDPLSGERLGDLPLEFLVDEPDRKVVRVLTWMGQPLVLTVLSDGTVTGEYETGSALQEPTTRTGEERPISLGGLAATSGVVAAVSAAAGRQPITLGNALQTSWQVLRGRLPEFAGITPLFGAAVLLLTAGAVAYGKLAAALRLPARGTEADLGAFTPMPKTHWNSISYAQGGVVYLDVQAMLRLPVFLRDAFRAHENAHAEMQRVEQRTNEGWAFRVFYDVVTAELARVWQTSNLQDLLRRGGVNILFVTGVFVVILLGVFGTDLVFEHPSVFPRLLIRQEQALRTGEVSAVQRLAQQTGLDAFTQPALTPQDLENYARELREGKLTPDELREDFQARRIVLDLAQPAGYVFTSQEELATWARRLVPVLGNQVRLEASKQVLAAELKELTAWRVQRERVTEGQRQALAGYRSQALAQLEGMVDERTGWPLDFVRTTPQGREDAKHTTIDNVGKALTLWSLAGRQGLMEPAVARARVLKALQTLDAYQARHSLYGMPYTIALLENLPADGIPRPEAENNALIDVGNLTADLVVTRQAYAQDREVLGLIDRILVRMDWSAYRTEDGLLYAEVRDGKLNRNSTLGSHNESFFAYLFAVAQGVIPPGSINQKNAMDTVNQAYGFSFPGLYQPGIRAGGSFLFGLPRLYLEGTEYDDALAQLGGALMAYAQEQGLPFWGSSAGTDPHSNDYLGYGRVSPRTVQPHALALFLDLYPSRVAADLQEMEDQGLITADGVRDAYDLDTRKLAATTTYWDLSLFWISLDNYLSGGEARRLFLNDPLVFRALDRIPRYRQDATLQEEARRQWDRIYEQVQTRTYDTTTPLEPLEAGEALGMFARVGFGNLRAEYGFFGSILGAGLFLAVAAMIAYAKWAKGHPRLPRFALPEAIPYEDLGPQAPPWTLGGFRKEDAKILLDKAALVCLPRFLRELVILHEEAHASISMPADEVQAYRAMYDRARTWFGRSTPAAGESGPSVAPGITGARAPEALADMAGRRLLGERTVSLRLMYLGLRTAFFAGDGPLANALRVPLGLLTHLLAAGLGLVQVAAVLAANLWSGNATVDDAALRWDDLKRRMALPDAETMRTYDIKNLRFRPLSERGGSFKRLLAGELLGAYSEPGQAADHSQVATIYVPDRLYTRMLQPEPRRDATLRSAWRTLGYRLDTLLFGVITGYEAERYFGGEAWNPIAAVVGIGRYARIAELPEAAALDLATQGEPMQEWLAKHDRVGINPADLAAVVAAKRMELQRSLGSAEPDTSLDQVRSALDRALAEGADPTSLSTLLTVLRTLPLTEAQRTTLAGRLQTLAVTAEGSLQGQAGELTANAILSQMYQGAPGLEVVSRETALAPAVREVYLLALPDAYRSMLEEVNEMLATLLRTGTAAPGLQRDLEDLQAVLSKAAEGVPGRMDLLEARIGERLWQDVARRMLAGSPQARVIGDGLTERGYGVLTGRVGSVTLDDIALAKPLVFEVPVPRQALGEVTEADLVQGKVPTGALVRPFTGTWGSLLRPASPSRAARWLARGLQGIPLGPLHVQVLRSQPGAYLQGVLGSVGGSELKTLLGDPTKAVTQTYLQYAAAPRDLKAQRKFLRSMLLVLKAQAQRVTELEAQVGAGQAAAEAYRTARAEHRRSLATFSDLTRRMRGWPARSVGTWTQAGETAQGTIWAPVGLSAGAFGSYIDMLSKHPDVKLSDNELEMMRRQILRWSGTAASA